MTFITILLCIAYLFAGIGYYVTCKDHIQNLLLKPWENKLVMFIVIVGVGIWLSILGFAYIMSKIEMYLKNL